MADVLALAFALISIGMVLILAGYQGRSLKTEALSAFGKSSG